jgi:hypothetical protein
MNLKTVQFNSKYFIRSNLSLGVRRFRHHQDLTYLDINSGLMNSSAPVSTGDMFQDLPQLCEPADNTECYTQHDICVTYINTVTFN